MMASFLQSKVVFLLQFEYNSSSLSELILNSDEKLKTRLLIGAKWLILRKGFTRDGDLLRLTLTC
jgi:hypothetical protein